MNFPLQPWWRGGVIYQIYPRSFQDSNGDGIGDLAGITRRLPYLAGLGVDAVWLSPFFRSPMKDFGYDISDYCDVDPIFGSLADFDALVAEAHRLGLRVLIDQVLSHSSDQHPWFAESRSDRHNPKADWYVWADPQPDGTPPNNWLSIFGGSAWQWDTRRCQYYLHNFLTSQPDLNFHLPAVQDAALDTLRFWLDRGVDGFRLDVVNFFFHDAQLRSNPGRGGATDDPALNPVNPYGWQYHRYDKSQPENLGFLQRLRRLLDEYPGTTSVGEIGDDQTLERIAEYTGGGDKLHMAYGFDLLGAPHDAPYLHGVIERFGRVVRDGWACWSLSNHDVTRVATRWSQGAEHDAAWLRLAFALQLSLRGSPCIYQGDELGLPEARLAYEDLQDPYGITMWPEYVGRDGCRTPMVWEADAPGAGFSSAPATWLPVSPQHLPLAVSAQQHADSLLAFYRAMLSWRRTQDCLQQGELHLLPVHPQVLAFVRSLPGRDLLCAFNLGAAALDYALPQGLQARALAHGCPLSGAVLRGAVLELPAFGAAYVELGADSPTAL
ncbi:MAG: alpha glucosidase [Curvibacter sp.]|nr:alpha glucosidase [Curvibacter sp.]